MRRAIPACILLMLLIGCQAGGQAASPQTQAVCGDAEALAGRQAAPLLEERYGGVVTRTVAIERMRHIEQRLTRANPDLRGEWRFHLLASDKVNAFSLPGGILYVTSGLYERRIGDDDGLLAAVIAHEMAHVQRKDSLKPACHSASEALAREMSADRAAARHLFAAGYDVQCLTDLLRMIEDVQPRGWAEARIASLPMNGKP